MAGGPLNSEAEGQTSVRKHNPMQSHSGCCKGSSRPQPGHCAPGKIQTAPWSISCSSGWWSSLTKQPKMNLLYDTCSWLGWAHQEWSFCLMRDISEHHVIVCLVYCSALAWVSCCWVLMKPPRSEESQRSLLIYYYFLKLFTRLQSYFFLHTAFRDSTCFPSKEAISLHAPNQNVSSAVTDGWIWASCSNLMNNIYHLISQKLACNEAGAMIITSVNHAFKMMTTPPTPRIWDSQTVM